jgi:hypothetical protein
MENCSAHEINLTKEFIVMNDYARAMSLLRNYLNSRDFGLLIDIIFNNSQRILQLSSLCVSYSHNSIIFIYQKSMIFESFTSAFNNMQNLMNSDDFYQKYSGSDEFYNKQQYESDVVQYLYKNPITIINMNDLEYKINKFTKISHGQVKCESYIKVVSDPDPDWLTRAHILIMIEDRIVPLDWKVL